MDVLFSILQNTFNYATGTTSAMAFTLAIVVTGIMGLSGKIPMRFAYILMASACLIFGSKWVAQTFFNVSF